MQLRFFRQSTFWKLARVALALAASFYGVGPSQAQPAWPDKPLRLIVPYGPGSSPDVIARILAERISPRLGQPVVVVNRAGAGGNTGTGYVAKLAADGSTFVISTNGPLVYNTVLYGKLGYDPFTELRPVILAGGQANVCAVRGDSGIGNLADLVETMKAQPGKFNFSSIGIGSLSHLGVELLKFRTGTFAVHIPYASSPLAIQAIIQGDVQFACVPAVAVMPQVRAGRIKALAVTTGKRSELMPDLPTMKEAGFPEIESIAWMALMAPAGTPDAVVQRLNREINDALATPEVRQRMHSQFMEPIGGTPAELKTFMEQELRVMRPVIERIGVKAD